MFRLQDITDPSFLRSLTIVEMNELAAQIREFLIASLSETGGHLASNLGIVELTIALHRVFQSPDDKLIFDVGHQAYVHKILTGRAAGFSKLRQTDGLSGFLKRNESIHDVWEAGHSSTAIAAACGFELARSMRNDSHKTIAIIGDGSLNSGLSFEALNYIGHNKTLQPIIILNDNEMSISKNVGTLAKLLNRMRSSKVYRKATKRRKWIPKFLYSLKERVAKMLRGFALNSTIFDDLGIKYFGPIDGHNIPKLIRNLEMVKSIDAPCVLHVVTKKGKGYAPAEQDAVGAWHGVKPFDVQTGLPKRQKGENEQSWSTILRTLLFERAAKDPKFRVIIPAMVYGSDLTLFQQTYPEQLLDVGICESFSVCFAGAAAIADVSVFVPIYSSFLQRAYDQILHDVARQNLHVVFGIDRSGLVGEDGETHHGIYDVAYLSHIPHLAIVQAKDPEELAALFEWAFDVSTGPVAIRYSNHIVHRVEKPIRLPILSPSWTIEREGSKLTIIAYGDTLTRIALLLERTALDATLVNARFIKPLDEAMLNDIAALNTPIVVVEEVHLLGGLGSMILLFFQALGIHDRRVIIRAIPDQYVPHGSIIDLHRQLGLDDDALLALFDSVIDHKE